MATTQPTLGGSALPYPSTYSDSPAYRGGVRIMADGSVSFDLVTSGYKRVFTLGWVNISTTDRDTVDSRVSSLGTSSAAFVSPENDSYTVTRDDAMTPIEWTYILDGTGSLRCTGTLILREV